MKSIRTTTAFALLLTALLPLSPLFAQDDDSTIDTIVVTGTQTTIEHDRAEAALTPGGIDLIDMTDFRERNVASLADVLRFVPGIWAASDSGNDDIFFSSRGSNLDATDFDMNGIKLLQDGLPVTTADGNNHNRIIDPLSAQHAVVARGANALKYGASTLGGAINFVSPTAYSLPGADLMLNAGSHGLLLTRASFARVFDERYDGALTLDRKEWDGFRDHNQQRRVGLYSNVGVQLSERVATRFYGTWLQNDQELPGSLSRAEIDSNPDRASASAVGGNFQLDVDTWRLANKTSWHFDADRRFEVGFSVEEQALFHPIVDRVLVDFDGPGPAPPVEVFSLLIDTDHRDIGVTARYYQRIGDHDVVAGANYGRNAVEGEHYRNLGGVRNGLSTHAGFRRYIDDLGRR